MQSWESELPDIDHPRTLSPRDRKEWHLHCERLLDMYDLMPEGDSPRKCIAGGDDQGNILFVCKASYAEGVKICDFIASLDEIS